MKSSVAVAGLGAVTAAGDGINSLLQAVEANSLELRKCKKYRGDLYMTNRVGAVPEDTWEKISELYTKQSRSRTFQLASHALSEAISQTKEQLNSLDPKRIGFVLSTTKAEITALEALTNSKSCDAESEKHIIPYQLAADLAKAHNALGPVQCVSVACISGLLAIQQGARLILRGDADAVLVSGVDIISHFVLAGFSTLKSLDPDGCRPFDKERKGLTLGEATGAMVLFKACPASNPLAKIRGWGVSNDANHLTGPSRDGYGLSLAINRALKMANYPPSSIEYVNAHGTGTAYNDRMEALALKTVFADLDPPVSSCKGMIGHTLGAAGVIESILSIISARANVMPGTPGFSTPDEEAPVNILKDPRPDTEFSRILKINSGFGGMNSALILEVMNS
ncbi:beta-ketoacyl-[acyl-carrier-protein] synthase family protein [PVC group bacterium]|nr:beta-ketoacyl-[acyl-carrier-protein] synthase family protein [PVC group bacterium]